MENSEGARVIEIETNGPIGLPADTSLLTAEYVRDGGDLRLESGDGSVTIVKGYFDSDSLQNLEIGGAVVPARVVGKLARTPAESDDAPVDAASDGAGDDAAAGAGSGVPSYADVADARPVSEAIGEVSEMVGGVYIVRADGVKVAAGEGAPLFEDDVLITDGGGSVGVTFMDGMTFSLGEGGRLVLDEFAYDAEADEGGGLLSVLQGKFSFVSGDAAHTGEDALMIETPTMTIGVRGTKVVSQIDADGGTSRIALLAEEDGTVGKIMVFTDAGEELISEPNRMVEVTDRFSPPSQQIELNSAQVVEFFGAALESLPAPKEFFEPDHGADHGAGQGALRQERARVEAEQFQAADAQVYETASISDAAETGGSARASVDEEIDGETAGEDGAGDEGDGERSAADILETVEDEVEEIAAAKEQFEEMVETTAARVAKNSEASDPTLDPLRAATVTRSATATRADVSADGTVSANSAPTLDNSGSPTLTAVSEDDSAPNGNTVASIVADGSIADADGSAAEAIALTGVDNTNGAWQYSTDGGATFSAVGAVSDNAAILLDSAAILRFVPNADYAGSATITYRAWDQSTGSNGQTGVDVSSNGGTTAFSAAAESAGVTIAAVNDAPVLDTSLASTLSNVLENASAPAGNTICQIVGDGAMTDADGSISDGVAITSVDDANGTWQYSIDGGSTFADIGAVSDNSALLLDNTAIVRFAPDASYNGGATFTYRAWDRSTGSNGDTGVDVSINGGTTAFSTAVETASVTVTAVNNAPTLDNSGAPTLTAVLEDAAAPSGDTVADIVADGSVADADGAAAEAIALTGVDNANGTWEYSTDGGSTFSAVGAVSDNSAMLLNGGAVLRFVPNAEYAGSASITYRAWDQSTGANGQTGVDVSTNGGTTAFSAAAETATVTITAVNDAPVLDNSAAPTLTGILEDAAAPVGDTVGAIVTNASIADADGGAVEAIALTGADNANGTWEYSTDGGSTFSAVGAVSDGAALLLDSAAVLRFAPNANYAGSATISYRAWDQTLGSSGETTDVSTNGGSSAFSAASETASVTIAAVNDAPVLDASGAPDLGVVLQNATDPDGVSVSNLLADGAITDADGDPVDGIALTGVDDTNGTWEYSLDGGATFTAAGPRWEANSLLLDGSAQLRFVPDAGYTGGASVQFRAWDQTSGSVGDTGVDTTVNGAGTPFSIATDQADITVAINLPPTLETPSAADFSSGDWAISFGDAGASNNDLDLKDGDLTIEAWFYYDGNSASDSMIVSKGNDSENTSGYSIRIDGTELALRLNTNGSGSNAGNAATAIDLGSTPGWHHVAMVIDNTSGTIKGYLDGSATGWSSGHQGVSDNTFTPGSLDNTNAFVIGASDRGSGDFREWGEQAVSDVRVWDKARSGAEISADMGRTLDGDEANLVANFRLDEGAGTTVGDTGGGGLLGSLLGSITWLTQSVFSTADTDPVHGRLSASESEGDALTYSVLTNGANGAATIDAQTGAWEYVADNGFSGVDTVSYQVSDGNGGVDTVSISITVT